LLGVYNLFWIKEKYEWKIVFKIKFEHFEYLILLFELINILAIFQTIINYILKEYIDKIVIVYLDNIFIFSKTLKEHKAYIYFILTTLKQTNLYINVYKNTFYSQEIDYLGFKIRLRTIEMNNKKIEVIRYWLQSTNVKKVRGFLGFVNFYRRFVERFKRLTISFIKFTKNDKTFK